MKYLYEVLDGRAQFDMDRASVLECCGYKKPSWKSLQEYWGQQGAVLVRYPIKSGKKGEYADGDNAEIVGVIN